MEDGTRLKELHEAQKKQEILLEEERALIQASEQHFHGQLENLVAMQAGLQNTLEEYQRSIQQQLQSMVEQMQAYNRNKSVLGEGLTAHVDRASTPYNVSPPQVPAHDHHTETHTGISQGSFSPSPKLEFPRFVGEEHRAWIRRCNRYFQVVNTINEEQKLPIASIHLEGKAEMWFQGYLEGRPMPTWSQFIQAVRTV